ncbi:hypothetical protein DSCO28_33430 [Desulfosarcina ovata subsp. sediminis]|uniref:DUF1919 domain-containing protein n=1 Tax=Desulfosarcina ovata subsp. sediminis TaxID=885957 RepID=A0A5K7ZPU3_9BACT|nr:DUF1919 domain-containing protein [Desulfosarcina ovata]BBO82777.1 hypothetical protein DSCO28_33430 [Desulfosarcina ovata subsp. sediminis]
MQIGKRIKRNLVDFRDKGHATLSSYLRRKKLHDKKFTIVASNCLGAKLYQELALPYQTPFVGLFLFAPCYIKLISNLSGYLNAGLSFVSRSRYHDNGYVKASKIEFKWPIGLLGNEVEIHFQHYRDEDEAREKWNRRIQRMNFDRLFFTFTDRDLCTREHLEDFDKQRLGHTVCFTAKPHLHLQSAIYLPEYRNDNQVGDIITNFDICRRHFDYIDWLNGHSGKIDQ